MSVCFWKYYQWTIVVCMESAMNMFYFLIKCDSSILNMCCATFLLGRGGLHLFKTSHYRSYEPQLNYQEDVRTTNYVVLSLVSVATEVNGCWQWCENAAISRRGAHLQRIICQSTWNVLKLLTALVLVVTSVIGCISRAVSVMVAYVFSGAACLIFDFLQKAGPMDGRFLAQNLEV